MSKQIIPSELAEIIEGLITNPEGMGELSTSESYSEFLEDIAKVVANHCGGIINMVSSPDCPECDDETGEYMISVSSNDSLPSLEKNVWSPYDLTGTL